MQFTLHYKLGSLFGYHIGTKNRNLQFYHKSDNINFQDHRFTVHFRNETPRKIILLKSNIFSIIYCMNSERTVVLHMCGVYRYSEDLYMSALV